MILCPSIVIELTNMNFDPFEALGIYRVDRTLIDWVIVNHKLTVQLFVLYLTSTKSKE